MIWEHKEEDFPHRTKAAETVYYFSKKGIKCVAVKNDTEQTRNNNGRSYSHDQRFIIIDEPMPHQNEEVCVIYNCGYLPLKNMCS